MGFLFSALACTTVRSHAHWRFLNAFPVAESSELQTKVLPSASLPKEIRANILCRSVAKSRDNVAQVIDPASRDRWHDQAAEKYPVTHGQMTYWGTGPVPISNHASQRVQPLA